MLREIQRHLSIARSERSATDPERCAGCEQRVELAFLVPRDPRGQDTRFKIRCGDESALELRDRIEERSLTGSRRVDAVPADGEAGERALLDRLDLFAQPRERALAQRAEYTRVDPLGAVSARAELALDHRPRRGKFRERAEHERRTDADTPRQIGRGERTVRARVPPHERDQGTWIADEERIGEALRDHDAQRVSVLRRVLGRDEARLESDRPADDAALLLEIRQPLVDMRAGDRPGGDVVAREIAEPQQQVVHCVGMLRDAVRREVLKL